MAQLKEGTTIGGVDILHILDLLDIELGRNENGSWVRWNNGLQVCWCYLGKIENVTPTSNKSGGAEATVYYYDINNIPFPKAFSSNPAVFADSNPQYYGDMSTVVTSKALAECTIRVTSLANFTLIYSVAYFAIGWWKEPDIEGFTPTE